MAMPSEEKLAQLAKYQQPVNIADAPLYFKGLIFGDGGVGKTVLSCRLGKTYLFSADAGWTVLKNKFPFDLDVQKVDSQDYSHLEAVSEAFKYQAPGYTDFDTVVIDPLSGISEDYLDYLIREVNLPKRGQGVYKDKANAAKQRLKPIETTGFDDYHALRIYMRPIIRNLIAAPVNVIFTTHEKDAEFMKENSKILPDLTDKVYKLCLYYTHVTARMTREGDKRYLTMRTNSKFAAKSRIQALDGKTVTDEEFITEINNWRNK